MTRFLLSRRDCAAADDTRKSLTSPSISGREGAQTPNQWHQGGGIPLRSVSTRTCQSRVAHAGAPERGRPTGHKLTATSEKAEWGAGSGAISPTGVCRTVRRTHVSAGPFPCRRRRKYIKVCRVVLRCVRGGAEQCGGMLRTGITCSMVC